MLAEKVFLSFFATPFILGGSYLLRLMYEARQRAADIEAVDPTPIDELQPGSGFTVVDGTARAVGDDRVKAAILDCEGVYVYTQIEERSAQAVSENTGPA